MRPCKKWRTLQVSLRLSVSTPAIPFHSSASHCSPPGSSGKADVFVSTPAGSTTSAKSFQYLQSVQSHAKPGFFKFLLYDQKRQRLYLTNNEHVDIFDFQQNTFLAPLQPPGGPPPNAGLRGLALTPDSSQLIVADFGAQNVYLLGPVKGTGTSVSVGGVPGFTNSGPARVAATSTQTVVVALSGEGGSSGSCSTCLAQMDLTVSPPTIQPAPQPQVTSLTGAPLVQGTAAGDRVFVAFGAAPGGPVAVWSASAPQSVRHFCGECLHDGSRSRVRRHHVCLPVKRHDRNTRRRYFFHFRSHFG